MMRRLPTGHLNWSCLRVLRQEASATMSDLHPQRKLDLRAAVRTLYAFSRPEDWFQAAAEALRHVVQLDSVTWARMALNTALPLADARIDLPDFDAQPFLPRFTETYSQHPITRQRILDNPSKSVLFTSDFPPGLYGTDLHADVLRPMGINIQGRIPLRLSTDTLVGLGVNRITVPFDETDREALSKFQKWLISSDRLAEAEGRLNADRARWAGQIEIDDAGLATFIGPAEKILAHFFPGERPSHRLPGDLGDWAAEQFRRISDPFGAEPPAEFFPPRENTSGSLFIRWKLKPHSDHSLLLLEYRSVPSDTTLVEHLKERSSSELGRPFSERQAQAFLWLLRGESNKGIAERLGITLRMVRKHVEDVYARLSDRYLQNVSQEEMRTHAALVGRSWLADHEASLPILNN
jgi:hypothetical protein